MKVFDINLMKFDFQYKLCQMMLISNMKELSAIIEELQTLNQKIIEKDNFLNNFNELIELTATLIKDDDLMKSEIYLDLRLKYISTIEQKLQKLQQSHITIEPQNIFQKQNQSQPQPQAQTSQALPTKAKKKQFTSVDVSAPISTDIYMAPKQRPLFSRKKAIASQIVDKDKPAPDVATPTYVQFEYDEVTYLIDTNSTKNIYPIYNVDLQLAGSLEGPNVTLLDNDDLTKSVTIVLNSIKMANLPASGKILDTYAII
jgi:hypothetical protein